MRLMDKYFDTKKEIYSLVTGDLGENGEVQFLFLKTYVSHKM